MRTMDLNCDLGEVPALRAADLALLDIVSSANVACGGHAGDEDSMRWVVEAARARGVAVGAHPSYPDRAGFGRVEMAMGATEVEEVVREQVGALARIAGEAGVALVHVKPHGSLYHAAMTRREVAEAVASGVRKVDERLLLVGLAGAKGLEWWRAAGMTVAAEAFADRRYDADGSLRSRFKPDAMITDPAAAAEQAVRMAAGRGVMAADGSVVAVRAETICIHGDTEGAAGIARAVRRGLEGSGVRIAALA